MIDWLSLLIVAGTALLASATVVALFATGVKLLSVPPRDAVVAEDAAPRDDETDDVADDARPRIATIGGTACFVLAGLGVLYGVYLIVPALHG